MEIKISKNGNDVYLAELSGVMDIYGSGQFKELIVKITERKAEYIIVSMKKVDSVDSSGIGALLYVSSTLKKLNCPFIIVAPEGPVLRALELTRLKAYFSIASTLKEAVSQAAASAAGVSGRART
jgi:anti-sigma B factor antagonist